MALLTVATVTTAGTTPTFTAVNSSDTISGDMIGQRGVVLEVVTVGTGTTVTVGDPGTTPAGNPAANSPAGKQVVLGTNVRSRIYVGPGSIDPATGLATITYSAVTAVTAQAFRY